MSDSPRKRSGTGKFGPSTSVSLKRTTFKSWTSTGKFGPSTSVSLKRTTRKSWTSTGKFGPSTPVSLKRTTRKSWTSTGRSVPFKSNIYTSSTSAGQGVLTKGLSLESTTLKLTASGGVSGGSTMITQVIISVVCLLLVFSAVILFVMITDRRKRKQSLRYTGRRYLLANLGGTRPVLDRTVLSVESKDDKVDTVMCDGWGTLLTESATKPDFPDINFHESFSFSEITKAKTGGNSGTDPRWTMLPRANPAKAAYTSQYKSIFKSSVDFLDRHKISLTFIAHAMTKKVSFSGDKGPSRTAADLGISAAGGPGGHVVGENSLQPARAQTEGGRVRPENGKGSTGMDALQNREGKEERMASSTDPFQGENDECKAVVSLYWDSLSDSASSTDPLHGKKVDGKASSTDPRTGSHVAAALHPPWGGGRRPKLSVVSHTSSVRTVGHKTSVVSQSSSVKAGGVEVEDKTLVASRMDLASSTSLVTEEAGTSRHKAQSSSHQGAWSGSTVSFLPSYLQSRTQDIRTDSVLYHSEAGTVRDDGRLSSVENQIREEEVERLKPNSFQ